MNKEELDKTYKRFLSLADKKKDVKDEDLEVLVGNVRKEEKNMKLDLLQVICGSSTTPTATVRIKFNDEILSATATGNGPIDAAFSAVKLLVKRKVHLEEFLIQAITQGSDDQGKVHVQIENRKKLYYGFSANVDIITASVEAFLDAVTKIV
jgi:2-isopropylmalate synthase